MRRSHRLALFAAVGVALCAAGVGVSFAAFSATTSNPASTFSAKRIFSGARTTASHTIGDASDGSLAAADDPFGYAGDGLNKKTANFTNSFVGTQYDSWDMNGPIAAGLATSSVQLNVDWSDGGGPGSGTACWYVEVRRTSTNTAIGTYDNGGSYYCTASTSFISTTVALPAVTTSTIANDLTIRLYGRESGGKAMKLDRVTVTGSTPYSTFTLYQKSWTDAADGTGVTTLWSLTGTDANGYVSGKNWPGAATTADYMQFSFDPGVPAAATVTNAVFTYVYHPNAAISNSGTMCHYFETFNGATLLGTHGGGTAGTAVSCNAGLSWQTDNTALSEVNTPAKANSLSVRVYHWIDPQCGGPGKPNCTKSNTTQATLAVTYYLD